MIGTKGALKLPAPFWCPIELNTPTVGVCVCVCVNLLSVILHELSFCYALLTLHRVF